MLCKFYGSWKYMLLIHFFYAVGANESVQTEEMIAELVEID